LTAIAELLAAVEAGKEPTTREWEDALGIEPPSKLPRRLEKAFNGKMGAADRLAQTLLPDDCWSVSYHPIAGHYRAAAEAHRAAQIKWRWE
jgi:hypothetical protein